MFKIKLSGFLGLLLLLQVSLNVNATRPVDGFYGSVFGGPVFPIDLGTVKFKTGYDIGVNFGYKSGNARVDVSGEHFSSNFKNISATSGMDVFFINGYYDFLIHGSSISPYIGIGIGVAIANGVKVGSTTISANDFYGKTNASAFQLIAGVNYHFTSNITGFLSYKLLGTEHSIWDIQGSSDEITFHNISVGATSWSETKAIIFNSRSSAKKRSYLAQFIKVGLTLRLA